MPYCGTHGSNYAAGDYYQGDYYRGDYYRGDPFIHKKIIGGLKKVAGVATSLLPGPVGAVARGLVKAAGAGGAAATAYQQGAELVMGQFPPPPMFNGQLPSQQVLGVLGMCAPGGRLLKGYRWNKSTYVTRGGGTSRWPMTIQVHPKGSTCVRSRRMNVANPRALRRALTRASGFAKLARRYVAVTRRFKKGKKRRR